MKVLKVCAVPAGWPFWGSLTLVRWREKSPPGRAARRELREKFRTRPGNQGAGLFQTRRRRREILIVGQSKDFKPFNSGSLNSCHQLPRG